MFSRPQLWSFLLTGPLLGSRGITLTTRPPTSYTSTAFKRLLSCTGRVELVSLPSYYLTNTLLLGRSSPPKIDKRRKKLVPGGLLKAELRLGGGHSNPNRQMAISVVATIQEEPILPRTKDPASPNSKPANPNAAAGHLETSPGKPPLCSSTKTTTALLAPHKINGVPIAEPLSPLQSHGVSPKIAAARGEEYRDEPTPGSITRARADPLLHQLKGSPVTQGVPSHTESSPVPCVAAPPEISAPATPGLKAQLEN